MPTKQEEHATEVNIQYWVDRYWEVCVDAEERTLESIVMCADQGGLHFQDGIEFYCFVMRSKHFISWAEDQEMSENERWDIGLIE